MRIRQIVPSFQILISRVIFFACVICLSFILSACVPSIGGGTRAPETGQFVKGGVVKGFPTNIPLYKNAQIVETYGSKDSFGGSFVAKDSLAKVVNFYNTGLPQLGWNVNLKQVTDTNYVFDIKGDTFGGTIIVNTAADGKTTAITVSVDKR